MEKQEKNKQKRIIFYKRITKKIPIKIKFKKKDGSEVVINTFKIIVTPKKISFLKKKK